MEVYFLGRRLEEEYSSEQIDRSKEISNVHWEGDREREDVIRIMSYADVYVCSSRDETGPVVVYEAMSLAKPVISTPVGAVPEIIINGENGFLFENENSNQLSKILYDLFNNRSILPLIGKNALDTYNNKLKSENCFQEINNLIQSLN